MTKASSTMLPLGTQAPHFTLMDVVSQKQISLKSMQHAKATVIMFICNHCPYVKHVNPQLTQLAKDYLPKGVNFIAISANDIAAYPADSPEKMVITAKEMDYPFPYLFDETQEVARAYQAACTPDFFVLDTDYALVYRGQLDDSRPGNNQPVNGYCIREALDCILANKPVVLEQKPSMGCSIKWKQNP